MRRFSWDRIVELRDAHVVLDEGDEEHPHQECCQHQASKFACQGERFMPHVKGLSREIWDCQNGKLAETRQNEHEQEEPSFGSVGNVQELEVGFGSGIHCIPLLM